MVSLMACMLSLTVGRFSTPASPAIPPKIEIGGVSKCSIDYKGTTSAGEWEASGRKLTVAADSTSFETNQWDHAYIYLRLTAEYPDFVKDRRYKVSFTMDVFDTNGPRDFASPPELLRYKKGEKSWYEKEVVWPEDLANENPELIYGGANLVFTSVAGSNRYDVEWQSPVNFAGASGSLWIYVQLSTRPEADPVTYRLGEVCVEKVGESVDPPPTIASYSERVSLLVPPHPGNDVMTKQTDCPWDEAGLVSWENEVGKSSGAVRLPAGKKILLSKASLDADARFDKIEVPATSTLVFADEEISFSVKAFVVIGELLIGSPTCRVEGPIRITFFGSRADGNTPLNEYGTKGLAGLYGSKVDIFGRRFYPTWSRLARIVRPDDDRAYLQEAVNWYPGQEILLTTTIHDDTDIGQPNQNEVRIIKAVSTDGKVVQFTEPALYTHYAGTEYQGEVALLSRHVMLEGEPDEDGFGGHLLVAGSNSRARIAGVATRYMGQTNVMARYPIHTHLMEYQPNSYLSDNTLRDTYFRCVVIHGTHGLLNTENVAFNATGNCFYVEDGVEENNTISYNLAAYVKPIGKPAAGGSQDGDNFYTAHDTVQPADHTAAGFYFSNAYNRIIGNVASGGWSGFGFPGLPKPIGVYSWMTDLEPQSRPLLEFRGNVAHSSGWYWESGGCIYIGGQLTTQSNGKLFYNSGRFSRNTRVEKEPGYQNWEGTPIIQVFENTLLYGCNKGVLHWGDRVEIVTAEMHDILRAGTLFGEVWLTDAIINGASGNVDADFITKHHDGFQFYDISVKSIVTNVEFRNYQRGLCRGPFVIPGQTDWVNPGERCSVGGNVYSHNNAIWSALYHSDEFKPQQISAVNQIKYTNVDEKLLVSFKIAGNGASRMFNFIDFDGSATLEGRPTIVGSNLNWWQVCDDCRFSDDWQVWLCPKAPPGIPEREVAHIKVLTPDITYPNGGIGESGSCRDHTDTDWNACNVGYVALWGHGPQYGDEKRSTIITANAGITGITGTGWWLWLDGGAPKKFQVRPSQVPEGSIVRLATNYPSGTTFTIKAWHKWGGQHDVTYTHAASLDDVWAHRREQYFFDGATLYLAPTVPVALTNDRYERGGAWIYDTEEAYIIEVVADCVADSKGFCKTKPQDNIPAWTTPGCTEPRTGAPGTATPPSSGGDTSAPATAVPATTTFPAVSPRSTMSPGQSDAPAAPDGRLTLSPAEAFVESPEEVHAQARIACHGLSEGASCGAGGDAKQCYAGVCCAATDEEPGEVGAAVDGWVVPAITIGGLAALSACGAVAYKAARWAAPVGYSEFAKQLDEIHRLPSPVATNAHSPGNSAGSAPVSPVRFVI
ncbi:hypothetical protein DIPPA_28031 [Diplonema papillatum]|nr:hypothetical protein DIPPA_28031 [Diplonema papillatum]